MEKMFARKFFFHLFPSISITFFHIQFFFLP
jgi:hypothetical protein